MFKDGYASFSTNDIEKAKEFYGHTLGLSCEDAMGGLKCSVGEQRLFIYQKDNHEPATFTVFTFEVENIGATVDELTAKGVEFERYDNLPLAQDDKGIVRGKEHGGWPSIAWFTDPGGNVLAIVET